MLRHIVLILAGAGCGPVGRGAQALYDPSPHRSDFFAAPWPADDRIREGRLDLTGLYKPTGVVSNYLDGIGADSLGGFGTQSAIFFRFNAPLDASSLPADAAASTRPEASVFLVDTSPKSPSYGQRTPIRTQFTAAEGHYIGPNWLALLPEPGFPLRPATRYLAVVTDSVHSADGGPLLRDPRYPTTLSGKEVAALGLEDAAHVVISTRFTTLDPTSIMRKLREAVYAQTPTPAPADLVYSAEKKDYYDLYEGTFQSPNFQEGEPPYLKTGGALSLDADGQPQRVRTETLRFALSIPRAPMPDQGWPVVLYAHGTGGSYMSFVEDGSATHAAKVLDGAGKVIARMAMISIDQVLHGPRDPSMANPDFTFFNIFNLSSTRDSPKQGAADDFQLVRLVEHFLVEHAPKTDDLIRFDPSKIYFKGHSQGGLTGPLFLAYEPKIKGAVLSGAGANLILALLGKTQPVDVANDVSLILGESVDDYHPVLSLLQTYVESSDPGNYARLFFREPPIDPATGMPQTPKSIFHVLGLVDHYTPIRTIKALGLAMGTPPVLPMLDPIEGLAQAGLSWASPPVSSNVAGGKATAALCEYAVPVDRKGVPKYDGHFVEFNHPKAVLQSNAFLGTLARDGAARVIPAP